MRSTLGHLDMGQVIRASCRECGERFEVNRGGGFTFHLLRCDRCGRTVTVSFAALGHLHLRYLKGLAGPYCLATAEHDNQVRASTAIEPILTEEYHRGVQDFAGNCPCGGMYTFAAPARCPQCYSTRITEGEVVICYD
jgi:hypothetical protein